MSRKMRVRHIKHKTSLEEVMPNHFERMRGKLYLKLTVLQRGIIEKLIKRGKAFETSLLLAILGFKIKEQFKNTFPELIFVAGQSDPGTLKLVLPRSLLNQLFKSNMIKIKKENI